MKTNTQQRFQKAVETHRQHSEELRRLRVARATGDENLIAS